MCLAETGVVATVAIKGPIVEKYIFFHKVFTTNEALRQSVSEKVSLNGVLSAWKEKVAYFEDDKANLSSEVRKLMQSKGMMQYQLDLLKKRSWLILREAGYLRLINLSVEVSVGSGLSATSTIRNNVVGFPSNLEKFSTKRWLETETPLPSLPPRQLLKRMTT